MSASSIGSAANGDELIVSDIKTSLDKSVWFKIEGTSTWLLYQYKGAVSAKLIKNMENEPQPAPEEPPEEEPKGQGSSETSYVPPKLETGRTDEEEEREHGGTGGSYAPGLSSEPEPAPDPDTSVYIEEDAEEGKSMGYVVIGLHSKDTLQQNSTGYPPKVGNDPREEIIYDYTTDTSFLKDRIQRIKVNLNIPSAFDRDQLNVLMNNSFNRYNVAYPDYMLNGLMGTVFFTRPDLWLVDDDGNFLDQVTNDPQLYYISRTNDMVLKQLTLSYDATHEFIPLLCNRCESLDVNDESVEVYENIGETWTGNKMQYAKHSIRSMVAGTFNCKFAETYDLAVTHMMQGWCNYESSVYIGTMLPKTEYIGDKILDYACDVYMFLHDRTNTIKFFSKFYGVFPISVNKSVYSYDSGGDAINFPEQNITFAYMARKDLSPEIIVEFNKHSSKLDPIYKLDYEIDTDDIKDGTMGPNWYGTPGTTWSGPPFVDVITVPNGTASKSDILKLRYRQKTLKTTK